MKIYINTIKATADDVKKLFYNIIHKQDGIKAIKAYKESIYIYTI
jgi:hypothetical protein